MDESDATLPAYVVRYYGHFMDRKERLALKHLQGTMKAAHGQSNATAQQQARNSHGSDFLELLSDDPEVLGLANAGLDAFLKQTASRILAVHGDEIILNRCPKCGALAKTPKARQCRFCHHDWHGAGGQ